MKEHEIMPGDWFFLGGDLITIIEITESGVHCVRDTKMESGLTWGGFETHSHKFVSEQKTYRVKK